MERVCQPVQVVDVAVEGADAALQVGFRILPVGPEDLRRLVDMQFYFRERQVGRDNLLHLLLDPVQFFVAEEVRPGTAVLHAGALMQFAVQAAGQGVVDHQEFLRVQFPDGLLQDEAEGAEVGPAPVRMVVGDELYLVEHHQVVGQFLEFVVHQGGDHLEPHARLRVDDRVDPGLFHQPEQVRAAFYFVGFAVVDAVYADKVFRLCHDSLFTISYKVNIFRQKKEDDHSGHPPCRRVRSPA